MEDPNAPAAEPSISDLRNMLSGNEPAAAAAGATETPAPSKEGEPAPASEPVVNAERNPDGTFKSAAADLPQDTPNVSKRIGKLLAEKRAAEERTAALEAQLQAKTGSQPAASTTTPTAQPAVATSGKPKPELKDFDSYDTFNEALMDWKLAEQRAADTQAAEARTASEREAAAGVEWNNRVDKVAKEVHPDYEEVMAEAAEMPISQAMNRVIFTMDRGPEVAYHLAKNPDECARIAKLDSLAAAAELGAIRAGLAAPKGAASATPAAKPLPKPAANVGGSAAPHVIDLNDPKIDVRTFKTEFRKRLSAA